MIQDMAMAAARRTAESYTQMKAAVMGVVQAHFRPEFINRLDDIVVFHPLDKAQIREIAADPAARPGQAAGGAADAARAGRFGA